MIDSLKIEAVCTPIDGSQDLMQLANNPTLMHYVMKKNELIIASLDLLDWNINPNRLRSVLRTSTCWDILSPSNSRENVRRSPSDPTEYCDLVRFS